MADFIKDDLRVFVVPVDILENELTIHEKMVYMVLRSFVNPHELKAFPSNKTIARLGSMSVRTVQRSIDSLIEKGLITKSTRFEGTNHGKVRQTSNLYKLNNPVSESHRGGVTQTQGGMSQSHPGGVTGTHHEHNQGNNTNKNKTKGRKTPSQLNQIKDILKDKYKKSTGVMPFSFIRNELVAAGADPDIVDSHKDEIKNHMDKLLNNARMRRG